jgi:hypothetical protein
MSIATAHMPMSKPRPGCGPAIDIKLGPRWLSGDDG